MINPMPGATWFRTTEDAVRGIHALILSQRIDEGRLAEGQHDEVHTFWLIMSLARKPENARNPAMVH